jgi:hypothetical protein
LKLKFLGNHVTADAGLFADRELAGYEDVNDAERLSVDPAMRPGAGGRAALTDKNRPLPPVNLAASETEILSFFRLRSMQRISQPNQRVLMFCLRRKWSDSSLHQYSKKHEK